MEQQCMNFRIKALISEAMVNAILQESQDNPSTQLMAIDYDFRKESKNEYGKM